MTKFRFKFRGGWVVGSLSIPTEVGAVCVQAVGGSKAEALMRAATIAQRISDDPVMQALMPPQARAAIFAAKALSVAAKQGGPHLKKLWGRLKGPGKKRLAAVLIDESQKAEAEADADVSGRRYQTSYQGVRHPNRGAWMEWQDPDHDDPYSDEYEADYGVSGRRSRRRRKRRARREAREAEAQAQAEAEPELPPDDEQPLGDDEQPLGDDPHGGES